MKNKIISFVTVMLFGSSALTAQVQVSKEPLHKKVLELKSQGLNKSAISSKLNIGRDIVTKYFSQENPVD